MIYECLVGCFEFVDDRMIAKAKDGTVVLECEWNGNVDEKSFRNEKLRNALLKFFNH